MSGGTQRDVDMRNLRTILYKASCISHKGLICAGMEGEPHLNLAGKTCTAAP